MKNTTKINDNSVIFSTCHSLTKKLVSGTKFNYAGTFSACLKLFYRDFQSFCLSCAAYAVDVLPIAKIERKSLDFYNNIFDADFNEEAAKIVKNCVNYAAFYGLKKREADISRSDMFKYHAFNKSIPVDSAAPVIIDGMRKNQLDDIKQDIIIYLLKRQSNNDFQQLPAVVQLMRAGDAIVTSYYNKIIVQCKNNTFSLDDPEAGDIASLDKTSDSLQAVIDKLVYNVPKLHRDTARKIVELRYMHGRKNKNISEIASMLQCSERKIKQVISEIKNGLTYDDFIDCLD